MSYTKLGPYCCNYNKTIAYTSNQKFIQFEDSIYKKQRTCAYTIHSDITLKPVSQSKHQLETSYYGKTNENTIIEPDQNTIQDYHTQCKSC
jgi:hypothetical protein